MSWKQKKIDLSELFNRIEQNLKAEIKNMYKETSENKLKLINDIEKFILSPNFKDLIITLTKNTSESYFKSKPIIDSVCESLISNLPDLREDFLEKLTLDENIIDIKEDSKDTKTLTFITRLRYKKQPQLREIKEKLLVQIPKYTNIINQDFRKSQNNLLSNMEKNRWNRQINHLLVNQSAIKNAKIAVFGCGGIGSNALLGLSYSGVNSFKLIDFDTIDISNLNRQTLYTPNDVKKNKIETAKERILKINPKCSIDIYNLKIDYPPEQDVFKILENDYSPLIKQVNDIIKWADISIITLDYFGAPYLINDLCVKNGKSFYWAGVNHYYGDIYSFSPKIKTLGQSACLQCIFSPTIFDDNLALYRYKTSEVPSSLPANIGTTVIITGNLIAEMIIKDICGLYNDAKGKYLIYNAYDMDILKIPINIDPQCKCQQAI